MLTKIKLPSSLRRLSWGILSLLLVWYLIFGHKYQFIYNKGYSMEPTFQNEEWIIAQKKSSLSKSWSPNRFDIVIIEENKNENLCKRVIGVQGDKIKVEKGIIYLNGKKLNDSHGNTSESDNIEEITVPPNSVWLIGDNRDNSWYAALPVNKIKGLVIF